MLQDVWSLPYTHLHNCSNITDTVNFSVFQKCSDSFWPPPPPNICRTYHQYFGLFSLMLLFFHAFYPFLHLWLSSLVLPLALQVSRYYTSIDFFFFSCHSFCRRLVGYQRIKNGEQWLPSAPCVTSSANNPIYQEGQSERTFPNFALSSGFSLFSWFSPLFPDFWQILRHWCNPLATATILNCHT